MGKHLAQEAFFFMSQKWLYNTNRFSTLTIATAGHSFAKHLCYCHWRGERAGCVYLNDSIITRSNKHSTLGGYRFVISNPNVCTQAFWRVILPSLKGKTTQALKVWHVILFVEKRKTSLWLTYSRLAGQWCVSCFQAFAFGLRGSPRASQSHCLHLHITF